MKFAPRKAIRARELAWTTVGQFLFVLQALVQMKILATNFTKAEFGEWSLVLSISILISMLPFTALDQGVARVCGTLKTEESRARLLARTLLSYLVLYTFWILILAVAATSILRDHALVVTAMAVYTLSEITKSSIAAFNNAARRRMSVALQRAWDVAGKSGLLLIAVTLDSLTVTSALLLITASNIIGALFFARRYWTSVVDPSTPWLESSRTIASFSWPLAVWAIFGWFQPMISRWYLAGSDGSELVASFAVAVGVGIFVPNFAYTVMSSYLLPVLFSAEGPMALRSYLAIVSAFTLVLSAYTLLTIPGSPLLLSILADSKYTDLADYVPWISATSTLHAVASLLAADLFRAGMTRKLLMPTVAPGLLSVGLGAVLVPRYGLEGALWTFMLGQLIYAASASAVSINHLLTTRRVASF
jgi:O-antigen/teichoic acid export membrane protein